MSLFDTEGYADHSSDETPCPTCGADLCWEECEECGGEGVVDEVSEWYEGEGTEQCQQCEGFGGWWMCHEKHEGQKCWLPSELPKE